MSYILDALHKSERERQQQQDVPNLHPAAHRPRRRRAPGWALLIPAVVILVAIAAFAGYRLSAPASPANTVAEPGGAAQRPQTASAPPSPSGGTGQPATTAVQQPAPPAAAPQRPPVAAAPAAAAAQLPAPRPAAAAAGAEVAPPAGVPLLSEMPWSFRNQVPDIDYSAHVYSETGGTGFVILNGSMRYEGHSVGAGLAVREILPEGVVLEYRGRLFKLAAMKSWRQR